MTAVTLRPTRSPPSVNDARQAAESIIGMDGIPHVQRVMLFGSVARGDADDFSDIDLMVIVDDLGDYSRRRDLERAVSNRLSADAGRPVDVHVTDPPEWKTRTENVSASFEASLRNDLITLLEQPAMTVPHWEKELRSPMNNSDVAAARHRDMGQHLIHLNQSLLPEMVEVVHGRDPESHYLADRKRRICGCAANVVENAIKTIVALHGVSPAHAHDIGRLVYQIPDSAHHSRINSMLTASGVPVEAMSSWHVRANYSNEMDKQRVDATEQMPHMVQLAHDMAIYADTVFRDIAGESDESRDLALRLDELEKNAAEGVGITVKRQWV